MRYTGDLLGDFTDTCTQRVNLRGDEPLPRGTADTHSPGREEEYGTTKSYSYSDADSHGRSGVARAASDGQ